VFAGVVGPLPRHLLECSLDFFELELPAFDHDETCQENTRD
jgi:hypothetical protein